MAAQGRQSIRGAGRRAHVWPGARRGTRRLVQSESQQYESDEDPDTGAATTPEEVVADDDRDQAEGGDAPEEGTG